MVRWIVARKFRPLALSVTWRSNFIVFYHLLSWPKPRPGKQGMIEQLQSGTNLRDKYQDQEKVIERVDPPGSFLRIFFVGDDQSLPCWGNSPRYQHQLHRLYDATWYSRRSPFSFHVFRFRINDQRYDEFLLYGLFGKPMPIGEIMSTLATGESRVLENQGMQIIVILNH